MSVQLSFFYQLIKSRIVYLVLVTTAAGFYLGYENQATIFNWKRFLLTLLAAGLSCAGVCALNQVIEWKKDLKMKRTAERPIPSGKISPFAGGVFSLGLTFAGCFIMYVEIDWFMALGAAVTGFLYLAVYTPLKKVTWLNTVVGAIPGALPPVGGWYAVSGNLELPAWSLFLILFIWQHPHFYIIAWRFREDYALGDFKMLPVVERSGKQTFFQIRLFSLLLLPASMVPIGMGLVGKGYLSISLLLNAWFIYNAFRMSKIKTEAMSIRFLKVTVFYLPLLLLGMLADKQLLN